MLSFNSDDAAYLAELAEYVAVPSVSRDASHDTMLNAARWLARQLAFADGRVVEAQGHPVVRADWLHADGAPTILVYGHYDVQPTGAQDEWLSPPFELTVDGDVVRGRGATDDKGPVYMVLKTAQAFAAQEGGLPLNVKFLFEGEEEIGSPHLAAFVREHAGELAADLVISADGAMWRPSEPSLALMSKGLVSMDIVVEGAATDLHSGRYGGTVANPLHALSEILASLHDADGTVAVAGFYDGIPELSEERRRELASVSFDVTRFLADLGLSEPHGEAGYTTLERLWERPTLEVNGVQGGGKYTVIPHLAVANVSCRLVPGQDPDKVIEAIVAHVGGPPRRGRHRNRPRRRRAGAGLHDPGRAPGHPGRHRRARDRLPRRRGAAGLHPRHAAGHGPVRGRARGQDAVLLVLDLGRETARAQRVPAHPPAARGHASLGAAMAPARRRPAPARHGQRRSP